MKFLITITILLFSSAANAQLRVSADGHYLYEKQTNKPVFLNGESAWCLFTALTYTQVDSFFMNCQTHNVNFLQTMLIEDGFRAASPDNTYGLSPFTSTDFTTPREAYFAHCDSVIGLAKQYGIYLHCYISYLGSNDGEGWRVAIGNASEANMESWGNYIGARYKDSTNIMWGISGDCDPTTWRTKIDSMTIHLLNADTNHLAVPRDDPNTTTQSHWSGRSWLKLDYIYPYWGPANFNPELIYGHAYDIYNAGRPGFLEEAWYENEHTSGGSTYPTEVQIRQQMYYGPLSGAFVGQVFGNCPIWHFSQGSNAVCGTGNYRTWYTSQGHVNLKWAGALFMNRRFWTFIPDQTSAILTAGAGTDPNKAVCTRTSDSSSIMIHMTTSRQITVNLAAIRSGDSAKCWWFKPSDGTTTLIGTYARASTQFTPAAGDWIFVADAKGITSFNAPGQDTTVTATLTTYAPFQLR